jgi:hypothetical protein
MSEENITRKPKIFISYSWDSDEHKNKVEEYANKLRDDEKLEIICDCYNRSTPTRGLKRWMKTQVKSSDLIIIICTKRYFELFNNDTEPTEGRGVKWESKFISSEIYNYEKDISLFFPVVFTEEDKQYIPDEFSTDCISYNFIDEFEELKVALYDKWKELNGSQYKTDESIEKLFKDIKTQKNEEEFVELVSTYIELSAIFYEKSYFEKIKYLYFHNIDNSSSFICILNELEQTDTIQLSINSLEKTYGKSECKKIEVSYDTLAIDIHPKNSDYEISFYGQNSSKEQSYTSFSEIVSGAQDQILDKLSEKISELTKLFEFANIKTISLILPNSFLNFDFKKLEVNGRKCIIDYDIIVKLRERIDDHTKQLRWKDNWKLYRENIDNKVSEVSFIFEKSDTLNKINKDTRETYPLMLMNCQISDEISEAITENGISIVLYQQEGFEYKKFYLFDKTLDKIFENSKLANLLVDVNRHIRANIDKNIQKSHISLIWDDPNTLPTNIKNEERDSL